MLTGISSIIDWTRKFSSLAQEEIDPFCVDLWDRAAHCGNARLGVTLLLLLRLLFIALFSLLRLRPTSTLSLPPGFFFFFVISAIAAAANDFQTEKTTNANGDEKDEEGKARTGAIARARILRWRGRIPTRADAPSADRRDDGSGGEDGKEAHCITRDTGEGAM